MARKRKQSLQYVLSFVGRSLLILADALPLRVARSLSRPLAALLYSCVPKLGRIGMQNLDVAYGETISREDKVRILLEATHNMVRVALEFPRTARLRGPLLDQQVEFRGLEHIVAGQGGIMISGHLGNWEWMAPVLAARGYTVSEVVRPFDEPKLNAAIDAIRTGGGIETIPKSGAGRELISRLRAGELVGILVDQSPRRNGAPARFFGQPCWATIGPAMAAARTKRPIYPVAMTRKSDGTYLFEIHPPLEISNTGKLRTDLLANTQRCQDAVEVLIRQHPEQWLWFHRRWRERPSLEEEWNRMATSTPERDAPSEGVRE